MTVRLPDEGDRKEAENMNARLEEADTLTQPKSITVGLAVPVGDWANTLEALIRPAKITNWVSRKRSGCLINVCTYIN